MGKCGESMKFPNQVMEFRLRRAQTREDLAHAAGVTRQAIGLIETGKVSPSTVIALRIAKYLGGAVEDMFFDPDAVSSGVLLVDETGDDQRGEPAGDRSPHDGLENFPSPELGPMRVWVAELEGQRIARRADGRFGGGAVRKSHAIYDPRETVTRRVRWLSDSEVASRTLFLSGCDLGLGILADSLRRGSSGLDAIWFEVSNQQATAELERRWTHVAALHHVQDVPPGAGYTCIHFASAEMGWMVQPGNPLGFRSVEDLAGGRFRLVNRPRGSGARQQIDALCQEFGVLGGTIPGYELEVSGHLAVASAVSSGFADVGFGHASAAATTGLSFIPVQVEACTLVIPTAQLANEAVGGLLETLNSDKFRSELAALGPYDVRLMGQFVV